MRFDSSSECYWNQPLTNTGSAFPGLTFPDKEAWANIKTSHVALGQHRLTSKLWTLYTVKPLFYLENVTSASTDSLIFPESCWVNKKCKQQQSPGKAQLSSAWRWGNSHHVTPQCSADAEKPNKENTSSKFLDSSYLKYEAVKSALLPLKPSLRGLCPQAYVGDFLLLLSIVFGSWLLWLPSLFLSSGSIRIKQDFSAQVKYMTTPTMTACIRKA